MKNKTIHYINLFIASVLVFFQILCEVFLFFRDEYATIDFSLEIDGCPSTYIFVFISSILNFFIFIMLIVCAIITYTNNYNNRYFNTQHFISGFMFLSVGFNTIIFIFRNKLYLSNINNCSSYPNIYFSNVYTYITSIIILICIFPSWLIVYWKSNDSSFDPPLVSRVHLQNLGNGVRVSISETA